MAAALTETAAKCAGTAAAPSRSCNQARAASALARVSWVLKVLEQTMNSVRAGSAEDSASTNCEPSTLATNARRGAPAAWACNASTAMAGPRSEPPMPILMTRSKGCPVDPRTLPERTDSANFSIRSRSRRTSGITSTPCTRTTSPGAPIRRSAVCSTARRSVVLMSSPSNICEIRSRSCSWSAREANRRKTLASAR